MHSTKNPLRLGTLELRYDRLVQTKGSGDTHQVWTLHVDQVHGTSVRRASVVPLAIAGSLLFSKAAVGSFISTDLDLSTRIWMGLASLLLFAFYSLTRSVVVSVSAGSHTVTERLAGSDAKLAEAKRFVEQIDRASMWARGSVNTRR
ncbi:MAG: hypothetical protein ACE37F_03780 [Nannocystaceae bacterium]|nr:hypothetical protein [bacterium]